MLKQKVVIVGCGVIGAAIAYELSTYAELEITVLESQSKPAQGATGASLGVLMAACSQTKSEDLMALRLASLQRYEVLIPQLIQQTGLHIPFNKSGILCLDRHSDIEEKWRSLIATRQTQGFTLQYLDREALQNQYPQLNAEQGLHSLSDRALNPTLLVQALVKAAQLQGVKFLYNYPVNQFSDLPHADWLVITAGVGAEQLLKQLNLIDASASLIAPVGGQAIKIAVPELDLLPVVRSVDLNGDDINIVPLGNCECWVGATVEFHPEELPRTANVSFLWEQAIKVCSAFEQGTILETWAGYRPRPQQRRSPILGFVPEQSHILLATGHYRNGVLMAPVTAQITSDLIIEGTSNLPWQKFAL